MASASAQPVEAELEPEEEQEEDEPELGDELGHLGRMDELSISGACGPSRIPARRYAGIAERPKRFATRPSAARTATVIASSSRVTVPTR